MSNNLGCTSITSDSIIDPFKELIEDPTFEKLIDVHIFCHDSIEPLKAHLLQILIKSEYFRQIYKHNYQKITDDKPFELKVPEISHSTMKSILDLIYNKELKMDKSNVSEFILASFLLLMPILNIEIVKYCDRILSSCTSVDQEIIKNYVEFYVNGSQEIKTVIEPILIRYFSINSLEYDFIIRMGLSFIKVLFKKGCPLFKTKEFIAEEKQIPLSSVFVDSISKIHSSLTDDIKQEFLEFIHNKDYEIYLGLPNPNNLCFNESFARHSPLHGNFSVICHRCSTAVLPSNEWRLSTINIYILRGWSGDGFDYIAGLDAKYQNLKTGEVTRVSPFNFQKEYSVQELCVIDNDEIITGVRFNFGWLIDTVSFLTSKGRILGQYGTSRGGNHVEFTTRTESFYLLNQPERGKKEAAIGLYGFNYDVISSYGKPVINNLKFVFTALDQTVSTKLADFHGFDASNFGFCY